MPLKVFYLDDEVDLLEVFKDIFESSDIEVTVFSDPQKLLNELSLNCPDILFIDYRLPGVTGDEIASQIDDKICKILVSGDLHVQCKTEFYAKLEKPVSLEAISEILTRFNKVAV